MVCRFFRVSCWIGISCHKCFEVTPNGMKWDGKLTFWRMWLDQRRLPLVLRKWDEVGYPTWRHFISLEGGMEFSQPRITRNTRMGLKKRSAKDANDKAEIKGRRSFCQGQAFSLC